MSATATDAGAEAILEERARRLARPLAETGTASGVVEAMTFSVGRERYAIETRFVAAVARLGELVPLPGANAPVLGVARWRGEVLTIVDVRRLVGEPARSLDDLGIIIAIGLSGPAFGLLADAVMDVVYIDLDSLHLPSGERLARAGGALRGATGDGIQLLDAAELIARQTGAATSSTAHEPASYPADASPEPHPTGDTI